MRFCRSERGIYMTEEFICKDENFPALASGETVFWQGKPKKSAFITRKSLTLMPIALVWLVLDLGFILSSISEGEMLFFIIPFFLLHMMPVWLWLGNMLTAWRRCRHSTYYVTNRRVIIQGGFFAVNETSLFYKDLRGVRLHIGLLGKLFHTGDICFDAFSDSDKSADLSLEDLTDPQPLYSRVQQIVLDIQTDMEYPNAARPAENPGYPTDYRP